MPSVLNALVNTRVSRDAGGDEVPEILVFVLAFRSAIASLVDRFIPIKPTKGAITCSGPLV